MLSLVLFSLFGLLSSGVTSYPAEPSPLHQQLRRAVQRRQALDVSACNDKSYCDSTADVCSIDLDLAKALCPYKCGYCVCQDSLTTSNATCSSVTIDVCSGDLGKTLCPKTCKVCGNTIDDCFDHVSGISCADLPDPCNDDLGKIACPKFCGFCKSPTTAPPQTTVKATTAPPQTTATGICLNNPCLNSGVCAESNNAAGYDCLCPVGFSGVICQTRDATTTATLPTAPPTTAAPATTAGTTSGSGSGSTCANRLANQNKLPCQKGEIIFMIEYSYKDSTTSIDHEGDFIKELVDAWNLKDAGIRFGVVIYHDTVSEEIHITDFAGKPDDLKNRISSLTRGLKPSGDADLAKALDFVRQNSFKNARPDAVKVVLPIVHQMTSATKSNIVPAADRLRADCVDIVGIAVGDDSLDYSILHDTVNQPYRDFYSYYRSFYSLERYYNSITDYKDCSGHSTNHNNNN